MTKIVITAEDTFKVATLNFYSNPDSYVERAVAAASEAEDKNIDVVLAQEILTTDREQVLKAFRQAGYINNFLSESVVNKRSPLNGSSTGVFSRLPVIKNRELNLTALTGAQKASVAVVDMHGYEVHFVSAHLAWGAENGHLRLRQALIINDYARRTKDANPDSVIIAGGTFNDIPEGDSVRYMKGLKSSDDTNSAYWVDVTEGTEIENHATTRHDTKWGVTAAVNSGIIIPAALPARRLDYLFVHGWVHGKHGMPLNAELFGTAKTIDGQDISDHYGVESQIWLPDKN